mgnify:CR=1 FL=1
MEVIYIERMKEAYGRLFIIENGLRKYINDKMTSFYGADWWIKAPKNMSYRERPLEQSNFYHLENYLRAYPCFNYHDDLIFELRKLYPIRNKIAHCIELTEEGCQTLKEAYEMIMDVVYSKVRWDGSH